MTPERWQQIDKLLEQALEQEPDRRVPFLDKACDGDAALRREVESLLAAHGRADGFTEAGPMGKLVKKGVEEHQLLTGRRLGHYQVLSRLGEGGMGIVYKARDTHLDRFVAIKVLPPGLVADPDRKRRFVQEAKAASALNHPNIITIHDIASENGRDFIVMEYIEGKTLDQVIPRRGLKLNGVLKYSIQVADALAKAHAGGIIHRDLNPGNIMVSEAGLIKVLDFGLAKLTERPRLAEVESTGSPRVQTEEGMILGTVSYMSPEQAEGKKVDARSDMFSFGLVLYEMVTGQRAFQGETKMSTLAAILNQEPKPAREITRTLPYDLEKVITRCLRKGPERRWQSIVDVKVALLEIQEEVPSTNNGEAITSSKPVVRRLVWTAVLLGCFSAIALVIWFWGSLRNSQGLPMTAVPLTTYRGHERFPSLSPDGNQVAFSWDGAKQGNFDIYVKQIGTDDPPSPLTTHPADDLSPAWSPDGRWIAFIRDLSSDKAEVLLVSPIGGRERNLGEVYEPSVRRGSLLSWAPGGDSLVVVDKASASEAQGLFVLSIESKEKRQLIPPSSVSLGDVSPAISPDGRSIVFVRSSGRGGSAGVGDLYLQPLAEGLKATAEPRKLTPEPWAAENLAWSASGREIIFSANFLASVGLWRIAAFGESQPQPLTVGENGSFLTISERRARLVYSREVADTNIWSLELSSLQSKPTPFNSTQGESNPQISPDGEKVAFSSNRSGSFEIWTCDLDGSNPVQLTSIGKGHTASPRWSPDSRWVSFDSDYMDGQFDIYVVDTKGGRPQRLTSHPALDIVPSWSRDGRWIYFASNRSGSYQVWKMPRSGGDAIPITKGGGFVPLESPDGRFVYYTKSFDDRRIWRAPSQGGEETEVLGPIFRCNFDVAQNGIYFMSQPDSSKRHYIRFFSFATREIRDIAPIENPGANYISVSPDGRSILYLKIDQEGSDLMLVENFQ